jgi:hypothetical protein
MTGFIIFFRNMRVRIISKFAGFDSGAKALQSQDADANRGIRMLLI